MPSFKYVASRTKADGKIDVKLPKCSHQEGPLEFLDVVPNETVITINHDCHAAMLRQMKDVSKHPPEPSFKEI